jgi:hypothetical protein
MAKRYFLRKDKESADPVEAMTRCCQSVFGRLTQTASWGLAALLTLTVADEFEMLPPADQRTLRNLPARVYYGVNSDEAVALRLIGVPRMAAQPLVERLGMRVDEPLSRLRARLRAGGAAIWMNAMGDIGSTYHQVWGMISGEEIG